MAAVELRCSDLPSGKPLQGPQGADRCHLRTCTAQPVRLGGPCHPRGDLSPGGLCPGTLTGLAVLGSGVNPPNPILLQMSDLPRCKPLPSHCSSLSLPSRSLLCPEICFLEEWSWCGEGWTTFMSRRSSEAGCLHLLGCLTCLPLYCNSA